MPLRTMAQCLTLVAKNFLEKSRARVDTAREFLYPILIMGILYAVNKGAGATTVVGYLLPAYLNLMFSQSLRTLVYGVVAEKQNRVKDGMQMMGLRPQAYWISWTASHAAVGMVLCAVLTLIVCLGDMFRADWPLVFALFFLYYLTLIQLGFLISTFFDDPQPASQFAPLIILAVSSGTYAFIASHHIPAWVKDVSCLLSPVALGIGGMALGSEGGLTYGSLFRGDFPPAHMLAFLAGDVVLYFLLAQYVDAVHPGAHGTPRPLWWCVLPRYLPFYRPRPLSEAEMGLLTEEAGADAAVEPPGAPGAEAGIRTLRLRKEYAGGRRAVDDLSLSAYRGQVLSLLGPNGAGKTTTVSMLTGLFPATGGTALIHGHDIKSEMEAIRRFLGVCPQADILFPTLTVREHLAVYGAIKGCPLAGLSAEIARVARYVGLEAEMGSQVRALSGGYRRRVSVAIALLSDSACVFLDEPTSGLDPRARQDLWDLFIRLKRDNAGKTYVLTTHDMTEADNVSDRIAVMKQGRLRCAGSPLFLKRHFGLGYHLTVAGVPAGGAAADEVAAVVRAHIPAARAPAPAAGCSLDVVLPLDATARFPAMLRELDALREKSAAHRSLAYGMSMTTLEEVFLRLAREGGDEPGGGPVSDADWAGARVREEMERERAEAARTEMRSEIEARAAPVLFAQQMHAILAKRLVTTRRNFRALFFMSVLPLLVVLISMVSNIRGDPISHVIYPTIALCFTFGVAGGASTLERQLGLKHLMVLNGLDVVSYWLGNLLADLVMYLVTASGIVAIAVATRNGPGHAPHAPFPWPDAAFAAVLALYGACALPSAYILGFLFARGEHAFRWIPMLLLLSTLAVGAAFVVLYLRGLHDYAFAVFCAGLVLPHWSLCASLIGMNGLLHGFRAFGRDVGFTMSVAPIAAMPVLFLAYFAVLLFVEKLRIGSPTIAGAGPAPAPAGADPDAAITVRNLRAVYRRGAKDAASMSGRGAAVVDLSFDVKKGECLGLLGPNGAGKSTTIGMLHGLLRPSGGSIEVFGVDAARRPEKARKLMGVCCQENLLWDTMTGREHATFFARLRGVPEGRIRALVEGLLAQMDLLDAADRQARHYSGGMKRKLCTCCALIGDPQCVFLDEPSTGMDVEARHRMWQLISRTMGGRAVILTTHSMEEAEALCGRIGIMVNGEMKCLGTPQALKHEFGTGYSMTIRAEDAARAERAHAFVAGAFPAATLVSPGIGATLQYTLPVAGGFSLAGTFEALEAHKEELGLRDYSVSQPTLQQVFLQLATQQC